MKPQRVCVIGGAGYVGLVTGAGLAEIGHDVVNADVNQRRIEQLSAGESPIVEEGLGPLLARNLEAGRLRFTTDSNAAIASSDVIFIAVGTPSRHDGQADLSQVIEVAEQLAAHLTTHKLVVIKSTVPVGTAELVHEILSNGHQEGKDFDVVVNPEFLREGKSVFDFFNPERVVVGATSDAARQTMRDLYGPIIARTYVWEGGAGMPRPSGPVPVVEPVPIVETDPASAQLIKYASNAFLATRISFINEIAELCSKVGADVREVERGMGYDRRIGHDYLQAGIGFGGPCLEKDLHAIITVAEDHRFDPQLLRAVLERNEQQTAYLVAELKRLTGPLLHHKVIAALGLSFKAGTNDVRNSLAVKLVERLDKEGALVRAHDPVAMPEAQAVCPSLTYVDDPYEAVVGAEALLILTEWPEFRGLDYAAIKERMTAPNIIDARNLLDPATLKALGFTYVGVGRA